MEKLKILEAYQHDDLIIFFNDNKIHDISHHEEANEMIATFSKLKANYRTTHTNLRIALGDKYALEFDHRKQFMEKVIKFERELNSRSKELKKLFWQRAATDSAGDREKVVEAEKIHRQTTADERSRDRAHALELVNLKLHRVSEAKNAIRRPWIKGWRAQLDWQKKNYCCV